MPGEAIDAVRPDVLNSGEVERTQVIINGITRTKQGLAGINASTAAQATTAAKDSRSITGISTITEAAPVARREPPRRTTRGEHALTGVA